MVSQNVQLKHVVHVNSIDSDIVTARDHRNKTHIYLIANHTGPVYKRNGIADSWDILDPDEQSAIRRLASTTQAPRYYTENLAMVN